MVYSYWNHFYLTLVGIVLLTVLVFTLRSEMAFLSQHRSLRLQLALSLISIFVLLLLTMISLFHWLLSPIFALTALLALLPVLLILAPLILILRARAFAALAKSRLEEQRKLVREVMDLIDQKKLEKIKEGKVARGEEDPGEGREGHQSPG